MKQNKIPKNEYIIQPKGKTNAYKDDVIYSDLGQWKYPGQVTRIPSNQITMQDVPYPVQGVDDTGYSQMMYPGMDYKYPGNYVTEYPMARYGGIPNMYPFGGQNTKTHTHMAQGGWLDQYQPGGFKKGLKQLLKEGLRDAGKAVKYDLPKKLNKNYFKPESDKWYRQVGKSAIQDAKANKIIRETGEEVSPRMFQQFEEQLARMENQGKDLRPNAPFFSKGKLFLPMDDVRGSSDYLIKTGLPNESFQSAAASSMWKATPKEVGEIGMLKPDPSLRNLEDFDLYQKNWWSGYKPISKKEMGGWLDSYQTKGEVKPKIDFEGSRRTSSNSFPTSKIEAEEMLAEQRKPGYKKPDLTEYYREKAYRNKEEETVNTHVPQSTSSKAIEILSNPGLALKNYRGGRLPDYFSSNDEVLMGDPLNVMNMGYQFLTPLGNAAYTLQSADDVDRDLENEDYVSAGIDAAFVLPGLSQPKKWAKKLNKISRAKNIKNIKKTAKVQKETSPFTYKGVVEKFPGNTSLRNDLAKLKYNFVSQKQNPKLAGTWVNQHEEFMKGRPMSPDATGIIQPPADPNYLYNFKTYKQPPLEERFKNYKKEDGGFLDDEYRRGGQKRKKYTSKNIQSSVNDLFMRNETLFGPAGKKRYKPGLKYKSGGNWLDNLT